MKKIEDKDLKKMLKEKTPQDVIYLHVHNKLNLTSKQLDNLIKIRGEKTRR